MTQDIGDWAPYLSDEKNKDYFGSLLSFLSSRVDYEIFPPRGTWFKAFEYSSFRATKVIILGQDPYHGGVLFVHTLIVVDQFLLKIFLYRPGPNVSLHA